MFDSADVSIQTAAPFVHFGTAQTPSGPVSIDTVVTASGTVMTRIQGEYRPENLTRDVYHPRNEDAGVTA